MKKNDSEKYDLLNKHITKLQQDCRENLKTEKFLKETIENLENSIDNLSGFTNELKDMKYVVDYLKQIRENLNTQENSNDYINTLILLDDPFKRTSFHNKICLLVGFVKYLNSIIMDLKKLKNFEKNNFNFKIFISINTDIYEILVKEKIINFDFSEVYEFKSKIVRFRTNDLEEEIKFVDQYKLSMVDNRQEGEGNIIFEKRDDKNSNILLAREFGLDVNLFYGSLEKYENFQKKNKILPDIKNLRSLIDGLKMSSYLIKNSKKFSDAYNKLSEILCRK